MPLAFFGNSSGSYNSAVPFQRIVEPAQLGFFLNLEQAELLRVQRYGEGQRFYLGKHWNFKREDGEPLVTVNYFRKFIDKSVEFLMGAGFSITVPEALSEVTLPRLKEVWEYNGYEVFAYDAGVMGGITGDVFVMITYEETTPMMKRINPYSQGKVRINLLGSEQCFPTWDPINTDTLVAMRVETIFFAERGVQRLDRDDHRDHQGRQLYTKRFTQIITADQIIEQFHGDQPIVRPNTLGEIPVVHIKNISMPKEYYGLPDGQDLVDLQREFNEKCTDISDIINYQAAPVTVIQGARAKNLERGPKQLWSGLPVEAKVYHLNLETDLAAVHIYLDKIKKAMHELADIPEGSLGTMQPISNTSGTALHMQYEPLLKKTAKKRANYRRGFEQINYFILRILQARGMLSLPFDLCKSCGGRIVETLTNQTEWRYMPSSEDPTTGTWTEVPIRRKRCFHVDKHTLQFVDPREMRLKFVRQYGFGKEVREAPFWMIERELKNGKTSFWDYAADQLKAQQEYQDQLQAHAKNAHQMQTRANANPPPAGSDAMGNPIPAQPQPGPPPPPPPQKVTMLPPEFIDIPEEPEEVTVIFPLINPTTGEADREIIQQAWLVPTGDQTPAYLNPFETKVEFHDTLPKDEMLQAQLFFQYLQMGVVDTEWVQDHTSQIAPDAKEIRKRMKKQQQAAPMNPTGGFQNANGSPELSPTSETGANGDMTPYQGQAEKQQQGREQAQEKY